MTLDQHLSWPLMAALGFSLIILAFFIVEAVTTSNWTKPRSILAEFVAVFFAISVGIWINGLERQIDRADAKREREEERVEAADNLLVASIQYMEVSITYQSNDPFAFASDLIVRPNIIDTLVSRAEVAQRFNAGFGDFNQQYTQLLRISPATINTCGATREMYVDQRRQANPVFAANAWVSHAFFLGITKDGEVFEGGHNPNEAQALDRIKRLSEIHDCVFDSVKKRLHRSFHLYEALCLSADRVGLGENCDWRYISRDPVTREHYYRDRYNPSEDFISGSTDRDFSAGVAAGPVWKRFDGIRMQLKVREANPIIR